MFWDLKVCVPKMGQQDFPMVNSNFSYDGHFGRGEGGLAPLLLWCTAILILPCLLLYRL